jgi:TP901 family phage tail tape measure protein
MPLGVTLHFDIVNRVSAGLKDIAKAVAGTSDRLSALSSAAQAAAKSTREVEKAMEGLNGELQRAQNLTFIGAELRKIGDSILNPMKNAAKVSMDFGAVMSEVAALTSGTSEQMEALETTVKRMASTSDDSLDDLGVSLLTLTRRGHGAQDMLTMLPSVSALANAGVKDFGRASDITSRALRGFNLEAGASARAADVIAQVGSRSAAGVAGLGDALAECAPAAHAAGMSLENTAVFIGTLTDSGIEASSASAALQMMLTKLTGPAAGAAEHLSALGIEAFDLEGNLRNPLELLDEMSASMQGLGSGERLGILTEIFGDRAAVRMSGLIEKSGAGSIAKLTESLRGAEGAALRIGAAIDKNDKSALEELVNAWQVLRLEVGDKLKAFFSPALWLLAGLARGLIWIVKAGGPVTTLVLGVAAALGALLVTLGIMLPAMAALRTGLAVTSVMLQLIRTQGFMTATGLNLLPVIFKACAGGAVKFGLALKGLIANPVGLTILAIAAAAFLLIKYWQPISGFFVSLWEKIKAGAAKAWEAIKFLFGFSPLGMIMANWDPIVKYFRGLWDKIGGIIEKLSAPFRRFAAGATAGAMAGAAVSTAPLPATAGGGITPIERTIAEARVNNSSSMVNAPITINAAPGQNSEDIARTVSRELDARDRRGAAQQRARLYD